MDTHIGDTSPYRFTETQDWFSSNEYTWEKLFPLVLSPTPRALEIGSWEGRSAVFTLNRLCAHGGEIVCIDHFDLMNTDAGRERYTKIHYNLTLTGKPFRILDEFSVPGLMTLLQEEIVSVAEPGFDWVYIDGSHEADDTFLDGELAWRLSRKGAILVFDDYHWDKEPVESIHHPKRGIDAFLQLHSGEYEILSSPSQYQMVIRKTSAMRIGFLVKEESTPKKGLNHDAFGYGIHIAITADSAYAKAAAVAMRSSVIHTPGRITFYVADLGLSEQEKNLLRNSLPEDHDVTVVFISLTDGIHTHAGQTWAKIDMIPALPIERVLYLDADILVRGNLRELWDIDLQGKHLAAAPDVGYPMGPDSVSKSPYFNAGVLLIDLTQTRLSFPELCRLASDMQRTKYLDQDVLNTHFCGKWLPLSLEWNAQGLGTYVKYHTPERDTLTLSDMNDPKIVHFTGPLNPDLVDVLNPHVQPFTAKPWGYAGAPGHPYAEEWWQVLEETGWKGWKSSTEFEEYRIEERKKALEKAVKDFEQWATNV
ncbi:hypothetical protein QCA50_011125 [Cerrena zonata]|uniref:Glycosyltransferase family 8 protein n=1 Tax=Cerrena zonata TaxID=2478898 RepID=A0AAW0G644_9APHY